LDRNEQNPVPKVKIAGFAAETGTVALVLFKLN
jgi:hypothetical protein